MRDSHDEELDIAALAHGGDGVGRLADGMTCFVPMTAPGDRVRVRVDRKKKNFARGHVLEIVRAAPTRTVPVCPRFGDCGGCALQHVNDASQLRAKQTIVESHLARHLRRRENLKLAPIVPSPAPWGYRRRAKLHLGGASLGFFARGSHRVVDARGCETLHPELAATLPALTQALLETSRRSLELEIRRGDDGTLDLACPDGNIFGQTRLADACRAAGFVGMHDSERDLGLPDLPFQAGALTLRTSPGVFVQANAGINAALIDAVVAACAGSPRVLDLYCGAGNFSLPLAAAGHTVAGLEAHPRAVADATANATRLGLAARASFARADLDAGLPRPIDACDAVVLDPPRTGARQVCRDIARVRAERIVYVSCELATLTRDANELDLQGYEVISVRPFDMFPQTGHIELLAQLQRR